MDSITEKKKNRTGYMDMTVGDPVRVVLLFTIPMLIGNVFQQAYSIADTMVAGYCLGDEAIAAIGATASLYWLLLDVAMGINSGAGIVVARHFGSHDRSRLRRSIAGTYLLNLAIVAVVTLLDQLFLTQLLHLINVPANIFDQTMTYTRIILLGMFATILYNMFSGILRAFGDSRTALYFLILSSVLNILLDFILVAGVGMGVGGAALATVLAQLFSGAMAGLYAYRRYREFMPGFSDFHVEMSMMLDLFTTGVSMGVMMCVVALGSVVFQRATNSLGGTYITAYTASRRWISILFAPYGTIGTGYATFISQNWGAGKLDRVRGTTRKILMVTIVWSLFALVFSYAFGRQLILFTTHTQDEEIISNAVLSIRLNTPFYIPLAFLSVLRCALQAMGHKLLPVAASGMEMAVKIGSAVLVIPKIGYIGTAVTEPFAWVICGIFISAAYIFVYKKDFGKDTVKTA